MGAGVRDKWNRGTEELQLSPEDIERLLAPHMKVEVTSVEKTFGGLANTNLKLRFAGEEDPFLLRFCVRDPKSVTKEFNLLNLVSMNVPVPRVHHFATNNPATGHPYILMEWIEGERLETILAGLRNEDVQQLGSSIGEALGSVHSYRFDQAGFFNENLEIDDPIEMGGDGLLQYTQKCLSNPTVSERLGIELAEKTYTFVKSESHLLDRWTETPSLTHCDFNCSNILVSMSDEGWKVAAVLDWEFAISATPFFDLGNLLRAPFGAIPGMPDAVEHGYRISGGELPQEWKRMSRLTDLTAWLDFLTRENAGPQLISDARMQITQTIAEW
jgi:aminoglycoside phosphotransferase (APT) family kinase protein